MASKTSVVQQILRNHGRQALAALAGCVPGCVWDAALAALDRMLTCGTPEAGFVRFRCETCGEMKTVPFTCKSRLCPSCGWVYAQRFMERLAPRLIRTSYRHIVCSVPRELRPLFYWNRELLPVACHAAAAAVMRAFETRCRKYRLVPGIVATCHTFGSNLRFHVHVHLLVTQGGLQVGGCWQPVHFFPGPQYRKLWQYHLLTQLRKALSKDHPAQSTLGQLFRKHPTGFIVNLETEYDSLRRALRYCCRYLARPPIGDRRVLSYDGHHVTFEYKDYKAHTKRGHQHKARKTPTKRRHRCKAERFVRLLLQHVLPRYARNIHYYGLYQPQARKRWFAQARRATKFPEDFDSTPARPLSWRERIIAAFQADPIQCPNCGNEMVYHDVRWPPRRNSPRGRRSRQQRLLQLPLPLPRPP